jgi:hypothetical protein
MADGMAKTRLAKNPPKPSAEPARYEALNVLRPVCNEAELSDIKPGALFNRMRAP